MRKFLSLFIAVAMIVAFVPTFASAEDVEFKPVTVDFSTTKGSGNVSAITGTGFSVVPAESTSRDSNQTKKLSSTYFTGLQVASEKDVYFNALAKCSVAPSTQLTIMVDMGENAKAGLYDIAFTGASWYPASNLYIFADGRYIGDYTAIRTEDINLVVGEEVTYKSVYLEPDENNQVKFMFAASKRGHDTSVGADGNKYVDTNKTYYEGRIILNKLVISESKAPDDQETVDLILGREKMSFIDNKTIAAADSNLKIIEKYEVVAGKSPIGVSRCYDSSNLVQIQTRSGSYSRWPASKTQGDMYTIETVIPKAGFYTVHMQGYKAYPGSDYSIYVNGEYAGDYSCWNGYTTNAVATALGEMEQLNTIELPRGNVEISFRPRKAHYNTPNLYPYRIQFIPAEKPVAEAIETKFIHPEAGAMDITPELAGNFEIGMVADFTARVKMTDGTYRSFGYTDEGKLPTADVIKVISTNPDVVAVSDVVCVEAATASEATITQRIDPTTTKFKLTAVNPGNAEIVVTAVIDGKEEKIAKTAVTVPADEPEVPGEAADTTVNVYVASENGGNVESGDITVGSVNEVAIGKKVTVKAEDSDSLKFSYWRNAAGKFISSEREYAFNANTNTSLIAVFDKAASSTDNTAKVIFYNENKSLITSKDVEKGTNFESAKNGVEPKMTGYIFREWSISDDTVINSLTRAVALYDVKNATYSVYIFDGDENVPAYTLSGKYEDTVTYTAKGDNFSHWVVKDGSNRIVSYDKTISFKLWANMALAAVYADNSEPAPTIVLDEEDGAYFIAYSVPAGYEKISAGIVFSKSGTPTVNECYSRAVAESSSATGQFTALPADDETIARGYLMFKKDGEIRVIYAD